MPSKLPPHNEYVTLNDLDGVFDAAKGKGDIAIQMALLNKRIETRISQYIANRQMPWDDMTVVPNGRMGKAHNYPEIRVSTEPAKKIEQNTFAHKRREEMKQFPFDGQDCAICSKELQSYQKQMMTCTECRYKYKLSIFVSEKDNSVYVPKSLLGDTIKEESSPTTREAQSNAQTDQGTAERSEEASSKVETDSTGVETHTEKDTEQ